MSVKRTTLDLTEGNIVVMVLKFAMPIFLGQVFQNLYNSVDSIVVGNYVGTTALAAVASCGDIVQLLVGFFVGFSTGAGVLFANYFGGKKYQELQIAIHTALTFSILLGAAVAVSGILLTPALLRLVKCPVDVLSEATSYLRIYLIGILFTSMYNVGAGVLQSVGDSKTPLKTLMVSSVINIVLDVLFVRVFHMGVAGVAWATLIAQLSSVSIVASRMLLTDDVYRVYPSRLCIHRRTLGKMLTLAIPGAVQSCLTGISNLFIQRYINGFGSAAMAGIGAGKKIDRFSGLMGNAIGLSAATFIGQNVGAKKIDRAFKGIRVCLMLSFVASLIFAVPTYIFAQPLSQLFTKDAEAVRYSVDMTHVMLPFFFFNSIHQIYSGACRGFGKARSVMILSLLGMIGFRQLYLAIALGIEHSVFHVYMAFPAGWITAALLMVGGYYFCIRRRHEKGILNLDVFAD